MIKTATLNLPLQNLETNSKNSDFKGSVKKQLNKIECEPCEETIQNILNYSKALKIKNSRTVGKIKEISN